jgi:hypothetical protein
VTAKPKDVDKTAGSGSWINLPVRLFLTDLGEHAMQDKTRITITPDAAGNELPAINGERLLASTLKSFIINSRVNQIELARAELVSKRHEITDITKLIVYSLLYRLFPVNLIAMLDARGLHIMAEDPATDRLWLEKNREIQRALRLEVFAQSREIQARERLSAERDPVYRKKSIASITVKLIDMIPVRVWKAMAERKADRQAIIDGILILLEDYINRSRISDYLSAAFLEWVQNAEKINLKHAFTLWSIEYEKREGHPHHCTTVDQALLEDIKYRDILTQLAKKNDITLRINWKFGRSRHGKGADPASIADLAIVRIRLVNKGLIGDWVRKNIETKINTSTREKHLGEFWQPPQDDRQLGSGLGLIYTAYLKNECQRQEIDVFVQTREEKQKEETIMTLTMRINPALPR